MQTNRVSLLKRLDFRLNAVSRMTESSGVLKDELSEKLLKLLFGSAMHRLQSKRAEVMSARHGVAFVGL